MDFFNWIVNPQFVLFITCISISRSMDYIPDKYDLLDVIQENTQSLESTIGNDSYTALKLIKSEAANVPLHEVFSTLDSLKPPFEIYAFISLNISKNPCLFSISIDVDKKFALCFDRFHSSQIRIKLLDTELFTNKSFTYRKFIKGKWVKIFIRVEEKKLELYIDCKLIKTIPVENVIREIKFSKQSTLLLGRYKETDEVIFQGAIQNLQIFPNPDIYGRDNICNDAFSLPDSIVPNSGTEKLDTTPKPQNLEFKLRGDIQDSSVDLNVEETKNLEEKSEKHEKGDKGDKGEMGKKGEQGEPGQKGEQGNKGDDGKSIPGHDGPQGPKGPPGVPGVAGERGDNGICERIAGPSGEPGLPGLQGEPGVNGSTGLPGTPGERGPPGLNGTKGEPGVQGVAGMVGPEGPKGPPGKDGNPGPPGEAGPPGKPGTVIKEIVEAKKTITCEKGDMGPIGPPGPAGRDGKDGENGKKGEQGAKGERGDQVIEHIQGQDGKPGPPGEKGDPGISGINGIPGEPGSNGGKGEKGERGEATVLQIKGGKGEKGSPGEKGDKGLEGLKGTAGTNGPQGPPGERGLRGEKGESGTDGKMGHKGEPGEPGPPGNVPTAVISKGSKGQQGPHGPRGPQGHKGKTGPRGPAGLKGPKGDKGDLGVKGEKGDIPIIDVGKFKGEKGDRGEIGPAGKTGVPGTPGKCENCNSLVVSGPPGLPGPAGPPGTSITGPKGEPGQSIIDSSFFDFDTSKGTLDDEDDFYTAATVIYKTRRALFKKTSSIPQGTLAFIMAEQELLLRVGKGWKYVFIDSVIHTSAVLTPPKYSYNTLQSSKIQAPKPNTEKYIRLVALNKPYPGNMLTAANRTGRNAVNQECYRQGSKSFHTNNFVAFLATNVDDLKSVGKTGMNSNLPVQNSRGDVLFESWSSMFNGSGVLVTNSIYSFNGKSIFIDPTWRTKAVWLGSDSFGSRSPRLSCDNWQSDNPISKGTASSLAGRRLLEMKEYPCNKELIVLCVEVTSRTQVLKSNLRRRHHRSRMSLAESTLYNQIPGT